MHKFFVLAVLLVAGCATQPQQTPAAAQSTEHNAAASGGSPGAIGNAPRPPPLTPEDRAALATQRKALENTKTQQGEAGAQ